MSTEHVYPVGDLIEHDTDGDGCPCGPRTEPVPCDDGSMGWLVVHHSLDGRERTEAQSGTGLSGVFHAVARAAMEHDRKRRREQP